MVILLILVLVIVGRNCSEEWETSLNPSIVSDWHPMEANTSSSFIVIHHHLNDIPIKVIADVKVKDGDKEYIFRGMGGPERDDDKRVPYGGVLVLYNKHKVMLLAPKKNNAENIGLVVYAGSASAWKGPNIKRKYQKAEVRIRVWKSSDFPEPSFLSSWIYVNCMAEKHQSIYNDIQHHMNRYPDFVNVQVKIKLDDEFIYEGQGSSSILHELRFMQSGGAVFGYSNTSIRIWFKTSVFITTGWVFAATDGWGGKNFTAKEGHFRVIAWKLPNERVKVTELPSLTSVLSQQLKIDSTLVNAQVLEGQHAGYRFYGVGSAMNDGHIGQYGEYGGMVYAVNKSNVLIWIPEGTVGYILNIGGLWGDWSSHQSTNNVSFRIEVVNWTYNSVRCPVENIEVVGANTVITGNRLNDIVQYEGQDQYKYVTGNLTRTCQGDNTWSGQQPAFKRRFGCQIKELETSFASFSITSNWYSLSVRYKCNFGYMHSDGDIERTCEINNLWSGEPPVCSLIHCATEHLNTSTSTTLLNITGNRYMDIASYKCSTNYRFLGAENYRYCQKNSTWSDLQMNCYRCRCPCYKESDETLSHLMSKTKKQLKVEKEKLSTFIRKKTCAEDNRPVAKGMGVTAGIILTVIALCVMIPDVPLIYRQVMGELKHRQNKKCTSTQKNNKHSDDTESLQIESVV